MTDNSPNTSEVTRDGVRAVMEMRWEDTPDGDIAELAYLVLFNERETPLRVVAGNANGTIEPDGAFTEILVSCSTGKKSWSIPHVDTDVGRVKWDIDTVPPKVQIDPHNNLE